MSSNSLIKSMMLLKDGLMSGSLITQFERLYKYKPDTSTYNAKLIKNKDKNRYRNILPCENNYILKIILIM